nr:putative retrotransposon protein [Tanacetum cinerariifolium]
MGGARGRAYAIDGEIWCADGEGGWRDRCLWWPEVSSENMEAPKKLAGKMRGAGVFGGNSEAELRVEFYCNAGFETDKDDIKSQTIYIFILNGGAVDWKGFKQSTNAMSATEAEYIAASEAAMEAVWIKKFISGLGIIPIINEAIKMFVII